MNHTMQIGKRTISAASPTFIVAEVSANHNQNYDRAVEIIHAAAEAGADAVKLQTYTADTLTIDCHDDCFMNKGGLWDGISEYDLYKQAYTPWEWQPKLIEEAHKLGMECFSSPFDFTAVDFLEELNVPAYKIASYEINDIPLIRKVAKLHKPVIFATGIAYPEDIERAFAVCKEEGNEDVILLKCVSAYPTPYEEVNLNVIPTLAKTYDCLTGISDHTLGTIVSAGAVPLGAKMVEKHLTLRRADGGPDSGDDLFFRLCADDGGAHAEDADAFAAVRQCDDHEGVASGHKVGAAGDQLVHNVDAPVPDAHPERLDLLHCARHEVAQGIVERKPAFVSMRVEIRYVQLEADGIERVVAGGEQVVDLLAVPCGYVNAFHRCPP